MKKLLFALLIMSLSLSLIACGGDKPETTNSSSNAAATTTDDPTATTQPGTPDNPSVDDTSGEYDLYGLGKFVSDAQDENFSYKVYENGVALTGYKGQGGELTLPTEVDGKKVTVIGTYAFGESAAVTSIKIPAGYTAIADSAFYRCGSLASVEIPTTVTSIGAKAFAYNTALTTVTVPASVTAMGDGVFFGCTGLTVCTLPDSMTKIPAQTFFGCTALNYSVPEGVTEIGKEAFYYCTALDSIVIPGTVHVIGDSAFYFCSGVTKLEFGAPMTTLAEEGTETPDPAGTTEAPGTAEAPGTTDAPTTPEPVGDPANGLVSIGSYAFYGLTGVRSLTIPETVINIGDYAFCTMTGLSQVTVPDSVGKTATYQGIGTIEGALGAGAFAGCTGLTTFTVPDTITKIPAFIVYGCENITSVKFNPKVTSIQNGAFGRTALSDFVIPDSVTNLGHSVFYKCEKLSQITFGSQVSNLMQNLFFGCTSLTEITIPAQVTAVGASAFESCTNLASLTIRSTSATTLNTRAFYNCPKLKEVVLPTTVNTLNALCLGYVDDEPAYEGAVPESIPLEGFHLSGYLGGRQETYAKTYSNALTEYKNSDTKEESFFTILGLSGFEPYANFSFGLIAPASTSAATPAEGTEGTGSTAPAGTVEAPDPTPAGLILTKYTGNSADVNIPTYIRLNAEGKISLYGVNRRIVFIGEDCFRGNANLVSVTFPETVEEVRANAFRDCSKLETADLSGTKVSTVGENAFLNTRVYKFTLPATLKTIGAHAFCFRLIGNDYSILPEYDITTTEKVTENVDVTEKVTDADGKVVTKADGSPETQVVTVVVTDAEGMPQHNANGDAITEKVTSTVEKDVVNTTTVKIGISGGRNSAANTYAVENGLEEYFTVASTVTPAN